MFRFVEKKKGGKFLRNGMERAIGLLRNFEILKNMRLDGRKAWYMITAR